MSRVAESQGGRSLVGALAVESKVGVVAGMTIRGKTVARTVRLR